MNIQFIILCLSLLSMAGCAGTNKMETEMEIKGFVSPVMEAGWSAGGGCCYVRVISSAGRVFRFRKPDYKGGFYLYFQAGYKKATYEEYINANSPAIGFEQLKGIRNMVLHFVPAKVPKVEMAEREDVEGGIKLEFPAYYYYYVELGSPSDFNTFDPSRVPAEAWKSYMDSKYYDIDPIALNNLLQHTPEKDNPFFYQNLHDKRLADDGGEEIAAAASERCDGEAINKLRESGRYDTIIHHINGSTEYLNTDMESYEIPADPSAFHIICRKFHRNGRLKEKSRFYPGVYRNVSFFFGNSLHFDVKGKFRSVQPKSSREFELSFMNEYSLMEFLEEEGWINAQTGEGKATMRIQESAAPRSTRLLIRSAWEFSVDEAIGGTVGVLIQPPGQEYEVVYIIQKATGTVLDKFRR
ncbi:hypothetical protein FACS1894181_09630 [Bacteroidia bacterium]|nr:hypothetical protein FACS1894181_09630 [Bacteroidia bacterium]